MITIEIHQQSAGEIDTLQLQRAAEMVLQGEGHEAASLSVAIVDDASIHEMNRRYLAHDYPTDVLSFVLEPGPPQLEGEVIVSSQTAVRQAQRFGWSPQEELVLYVVHGVLHLAGYDDRSPQAQQEMRERERHYLRQLGMEPRYEGDLST